MQDRSLISVTEVMECDFDPSAVTDYSIHCKLLEDFLISHGEAGAKELKDKLEYLKGEVDEYMDNVRGKAKVNG